MERARDHKPHLGVVKFASCDGCQLTLLGLEDHLLAVANAFDIVEFAEASSSRSPGPYDVLLVEGSVSTPDQVEQILRLRAQTRTLVTIGACAAAGGIQALRNWADHEEFHTAVYPHADYVESLSTSTPIAEHVPVDLELCGCPISGDQLLDLLTALTVGRRPYLPNEAVCLECKRDGTVCVMVARGIPCLGPVTHTGCGAICPAYDRGCYGCFGPREEANTESFSSWLLAQDRPRQDVGRLFAGFEAYAEPFRDVVTNLGGVAVHTDPKTRQPPKGDTDAPR